MTDAEYAAQKKRIKALESKWDGPLGMRWWEVTDEYCREGLAESDPEKAAQNWKAIARCRIQWPYRKLHVSWDMPMVADLSDDALEEAFVHERVHALVNEMREWSDHPAEIAIDHEERVVCMVTSALRWVHAAGRNAGKADLLKKAKAQ